MYNSSEYKTQDDFILAELVIFSYTFTQYISFIHITLY